jgi:hypothetical protein
LALNKETHTQTHTLSLSFFATHTYTQTFSVSRAISFNQSTRLHSTVLFQHFPEAPNHTTTHSIPTLYIHQALPRWVAVHPSQRSHTRPKSPIIPSTTRLSQKKSRQSLHHTSITPRMMVASGLPISMRSSRKIFGVLENNTNASTDPPQSLPQRSIGWKSLPNKSLTGLPIDSRLFHLFQKGIAKKRPPVQEPLPKKPPQKESSAERPPLKRSSSKKSSGWDYF